MSKHVSWDEFLSWREAHGISSSTGQRSRQPNDRLVVIWSERAINRQARLAVDALRAAGLLDARQEAR